MKHFNKTATGMVFNQKKYQFNNGNITDYTRHKIKMNPK